MAFSFTQRFLVLSIFPYSITDEKTGEVNKGVSVSYVPTDLSPAAADDQGRIGNAPIKQSFPYRLKDTITTSPAVYDIDFSMKTVQGKPVLDPIDAKLVGTASLTIEEIKQKEPKQKS